jgi:hypothetical protein
MTSSSKSQASKRQRPVPAEASRAPSAWSSEVATGSAGPGPAANFGFVSFEGIAALQRAQTEAYAKASRSFLEGLTAINREVLNFADQCTRGSFDAPPAVPGDQGWGGAWSAQLDYANRATEAYVREATRLFELGVKVSQESWTPFQELMSTAFTETGRKTP